ncbi:MAG: ABC transporter substrate-binding protein [Candidatus Limnocylindria bacterium]
MGRSRTIALLVVGLLLAAQSCAAPRPVRRDVVIGLVGEPASVFADDPNARIIAAAVTEQLVRRNAHDDFVARLATSVPTAENGGLTVVTDDPAAPDGRLVATFELRPGLVWQDGAPLTANDVRFAWETDRTAPLGTQARWIADRVERVDVITDRIVRFTYRANERWDGYPLAARVLPEHLLANASAAQRAQYAREPVHAGPFAVAAWLPGIGITLSAFKGYALGAPALGRLEIRFFPDRAALLDALRRGDVDVVPSPGLEADLAGTLDRFADGTTLQTFYKQAESIEVLRYGPRFADPVLRRAIELTVDRRKLSATLFEGRALVPRSFLVAPGWAASDAGSLPAVDRERARALLEAAGYTRGPFGILVRGADRFTVTILVPAGSIARSDAAQLVAGDLAAIGIAALIREVPPEAAAAALASGAYDLAIEPQDTSDPQQLADQYRGTAGPWFDILADAAAAAPDRAEKRLLYAQLERVWDHARPALPLYQRLLVDVAPRALGGVEPASAGAPLTWNVRDWHFVAP